MSRARNRAAPLAAIPEDEAPLAVAPPAKGPVSEKLRLIDELEVAVEERISGIMSAAEDAIVALKNECRRQLIVVPKKLREMLLSDFQKQYPDDFKSGALEEIRGRYAAMAEAAKQAPATARGTRTAAKRAAEPETVLRTVRPRRGPVAPPPKFSEPAVPAPLAEAGPAAQPEATATQQGARSRTAAGPAAAAAAADVSEPEAPATRRAAGPAAAAAAAFAASGLFNGLPLQTPMPFAGAAVPLPITMLTQKRGGRTKAAAPPDAAVITTADGLQFALGKGGLDAIPATHRKEVSELLTAQFEFLAAALGKTVFSRRR